MLESRFHYNSSTPGMAVFMQALRPGPKPPFGLEIRPVEDLPGLRRWSEVFMPCYGFPPSWAPL